MAIHNLPYQSTPFIGRVNELVEIAQRLTDPACRLLTLVGPGGIGKTRLVLQAGADQIHRFPHGVYFVPLQPLASPDFIVPAIAAAIGFQFNGEGEPKQQLLDYFREKSLLLVLDNVEHLLDGTSLFIQIMANAPRLKILATSRERLNVPEEWVLDIEGLLLPPMNTAKPIDSYSAVQLFIQRARQLQASFSLTENAEAVIRVCRLVEGMPLGIELAAAWVRVLPCKQIADEIERNLDILEAPTRNVEPRHRNMRAIFEPTWTRLSSAEQEVFKKLSVFRGGFSREAAKDVAGASLRDLSALVDKSLVRVDATGRYDFHELLRQYAEERLDETPVDKEATQDAHAKYYAELLRQLQDKLKGPQLMAALAEMEAELDNIRMGWHWITQQCREEEISKSLQSLLLFYIMRSRRREGDQALNLLLRCLGTTENILMVQVLMAQACFKIGWTHHGQVIELARRSLEIWRNLGTPTGTGFVIGYYTLRLLEVWPPDEILACGQEAVVCAKKTGDLWEQAWSLYTLGDLLKQSGKVTEAMSFLQQSVDVFRILGNRWALTFPLGSLEEAFAMLGEYRQSRELNQEGLAICREIGDREGILWRCSRLARVAYIERDTESAKHYAREYLQLVLELQLEFRIYEGADLLIQLLLDAGEMLRAVELIVLVKRELTKHGETMGGLKFNAQYEPLLGTLEAKLSSEVFMAATHRGETVDPYLAIAELNDSFLVPHDEHNLAALTSSIRSSLAGQGVTESLSERELEVLRLVADGMSNAEIAQKLFLSVGTVKVHTRNIYGKLGVNSRTQAIVQARKLSLL